jgi:plastocyanin domain-containing protein
MKRISYLIVIPALLLLFGYGIVTGEQKGERKDFVATVDPDGIQRVVIVGGGYFYNPNHIIVKVNVPVELKVTKEPGVTPHDVVMKSPEAGMDFAEELGTSPKTIKFTPTKTGKFPLYCSKKVPFLQSHREKGMEGTVEVVE